MAYAHKEKKGPDKNVPIKKQKKPVIIISKKKQNYINNKNNKKLEKEKKQKYIGELKNIISEHNTDIWNPHIELPLSNIKTNSCFDILSHTIKEEHSIKEIHLTDVSINNKFTDTSVKCHKVKMYPNCLQKQILDKWFQAYIKMYNKTLRLIKDRYKNNNKTILNYHKLRTSFLKDNRTTIINESQLSSYKDENGILHEIKYDTKIYTHMVDSAIRLACANYKSALTNYKYGRMSKLFRVRYWRENKPIKFIDIEPVYFRNNTIGGDRLGDLQIEEVNINGKIFCLNDVATTYKSECKLRYDESTSEYTLHIQEKNKTKKKNVIDKEVIISLDPGIRTFMTGISDKSVTKIGTNVSSKIRAKLNRLDSINNNKKIPKKIKKKNESLINKKITNLVDELHWKAINHLTNRYKNILIGDMSVKGITNKNTSVLDKLTKRVGYRLKFYEFRQRLKNKCDAHKIGYKVVDEKYTSKACSNCGNIKDDLGASKIYNCVNCKSEIDRDVNGARCILIKGLHMK